LAADADGVVVIAPECEGILVDRVRQVEQIRGRLLSPGSEFVAAASDKHETGRRLAAAGVPTPFALVLGSDKMLPPDFPYPAVLKPRDGAGSQDVFSIALPKCSQRTPRAVRGVEIGSLSGASHTTNEDNFPSLATHPWRLEEFCPGMAASIALLCGPAGSVALPACRQLLSSDGRFRYLGGVTPLAPALHARAATLAHRALDALPPAIGYVGFDLVLGAAADGSRDVVIEVNPRLTTSYVGVRDATHVNLAALMLQTALSSLRTFRGKMGRHRR
jgi:predicted ATP-grasp superfamily ATP-dependent carboligase